MAYTVTLLEEHHAGLLGAIFSVPGREGAAYLLCGLSRGEDDIRLLVREVIPVRDADYLVREPLRLSIDSLSYAHVAKRAAATRASILFVHSHPNGLSDFSRQDDREEPKLMEFFTERLPNGVHGTVVIPSASDARARVWTGTAWAPVARIRILGRRFRFLDVVRDEPPIPTFFDRNLLAFGPDIQRLLGRLHVGVVGAGGTGSSVIEQLTRLGVGMLSIFDGDIFARSNNNRVYGSAASDHGRNKAEVAADHVRRIGLGTGVVVYNHITHLEVARKLRNCDVIFGCTDKQAPRGILVLLALRYLIPVFDLGVQIDSQDRVIRGINGRVTTLLPGEACLFCRERINPLVIAVESKSPVERRRLADEHYAPELDTDSPAVVMFTTAVAAQGVSELLHRLTGFMGAERVSSEVLLRLHETECRTNRPMPRPGCLCSQRTLWGRGDTRDYLGQVWAKN